MGDSIENSVADGEGECWECSRLFIADASAFPTASGLNRHINLRLDLLDKLQNGFAASLIFGSKWKQRQS